MPHQVADQRAVVGDFLGAGSVTHAGGLHDGIIVPHHIDQADKPII